MCRAVECFLRVQSRSGDHTINSFTEWEKKSGTITFWGKKVGNDLFLVQFDTLNYKLKNWNEKICEVLIALDNKVLTLLQSKNGDDFLELYTKAF